MVNELKKAWNTNRLFVIILLLAEIFLLFYVKLHNKLIFSLYILPFLFLFLNIERKDVLMYELSLPRYNFTLFLDKFLSTYIPFILLSALPMIIFPTLSNGDTFIEIVLIGAFASLFVFFFSTHYTLFYLLILILTQFINPPINESVSRSNVSWGQEQEIIVFFIILFVIIILSFSLRYSDKIKERLKEFIVVLSLFLIFMVPNRILFHNGFFGKPRDILVNTKYVNILKNNGTSIRYLLDEKRKLYPVFSSNSRLFLWNKKDIFYYDEEMYDEYKKQNVYREGTLFTHNNYYDTWIITSREYTLLSLKGYFNISKRVYFRNSEKMYFGNIDTKKVEGVNIHGLRIKHFGNYLFISKQGKSYVIFGDKGLVEVNPKYRWLLLDLDNIYYLDNDKIRNYKDEIMVKSQNPIKYVNLRTIEFDNKYYTPFNDQIYEIPENSKFLLDKIYYIKNKKLLLKRIGGKIIMELPLPRKIVKNYLLHYYNGNYYLFIYDKKPLKIYKLNNSIWEKYDTVW